MATDVKRDTAISCLQHAIENTQETIRAYDTKAEILAILLTLAIGITNFTLFGESSGCTKWLLLSSWGLALFAIAVLGLVLYPKRNPFEGIPLGSYTPNGSYYLTNVLSSPQNTVTALANIAIETDWVLELTYENMKVSVIRDNKHYWYVWALKLAALTILLIGASIISKAW